MRNCGVQRSAVGPRNPPTVTAMSRARKNARTARSCRSYTRWRSHVRRPVPKPRRSIASMVSSAPAIALTTVGTSTGVERRTRDRNPACPGRPVEAADPLRIHGALEVRCQRRQEAECQVDPKGELFRDAEPMERDAEIGRSDGERHGKPDRGHREIAQELRHRQADRLGRDRRAKQWNVEQDIGLADRDLLHVSAGHQHVDDDDHADEEEHDGPVPTDLGPRYGSRSVVDDGQDEKEEDESGRPRPAGR